MVRYDKKRLGCPVSYTHLDVYKRQALAGVKNSQPVVIANPQEDMEEQPEEDVMNDSDVAGLAMGWMLKGAVNLKSVPRSRSTGVPASPLKLEAVGIAFLPALDIAV